MARDERQEYRKRKPLSRRQKTKIKIAILIVEILALVVLMAALFFVKKLSLIQHDPDFDDTQIEQNELDEEVKQTIEGYKTIVLVGLDNRTVGTYTSGNADTIIIVTINNKTNEVRMASVYRDTYMQISADGKFAKVNAAYNSQGGAKGLVEALNRNLDLAIDDYVAVDWYALVKTIDLIGGIEIELSNAEANAVNDLIWENELVTGFQTDRVAKPGLNELDGVQALAYARIRSLKGSDFARTERQRMVITKMLEKAKTSSISTLVKVIDEVFPDVATSLSTTELIELASGMMSYQLTETTGFPEDRGNAVIGEVTSYIIPVSLLTNVEDLHAFLYGNEKYVPSVQLQNISNQIIFDSGLAPDDEEDE